MSASAAPQPIFLTGFMGCGKTTIGRLAAGELAMPFLDLDREVERRSGLSISELFQEGEAAFRAQEHHVLCQLLSGPEHSRHMPRLISLGGGAWIQPSNQPLIPPSRLIFLDVPYALLEARLASSHRPLARNPEKLRELYTARLPLYSQAGHTLPISTEDDLSSAAGKLAVILRQLITDSQQS